MSRLYAISRHAQLIFLPYLVTPAQYETAKNLILDVLGWGVPPEYLVHYGLSREIIYYVFTELDLKYPTNLDLSDFEIPESYIALTSRASSTPQPEVVPFGDRAPYSPTSLTSGSYRPQGHPSLPQKPPAPQGSSPIVPPSPSRLSASATPFVSTVSPKLDEAVLLDMEQQRRQELLARKAAIASRRKNATFSSSEAVSSSAPTPSTSSTTLDPALMKSLPALLERAQSSSKLAPKETVDDFLNSIGPVANDTSAQTEIPRVASPDAMDVDEIPGLAITAPASTIPLSANPSLSSVSSTQSVASSIVPPATPLSDNQSFRASSSEGDRRDVENMMEIDETGSASTGTAGNERSRSSSSGREAGQSRRAPKQRPVAADFVDVEPPRPPNYGPFRDHPPRKKSFFAGGLPLNRRMVIEVSDTEDEDGLSSSNAAATRYRPYPSAPQTRSGTQSGAASIRPSPRPNTPATLQEKELEIKKMREKIAQRESEKQRRLAAVSIYFLSVCLGVWLMGIVEHCYADTSHSIFALKRD